MRKSFSNRWLFSLAFAFGAAIAAPARGEIVLLQPGPEGEDVSPYNFQAGARRFNNEINHAFHAFDSVHGTGWHTMENFVRFELPGDLLGPGEVVSQAVFWISYFRPQGSELFQDGTGPGELWCHEVLEPWTDSTLTWNNKPDYGPAFDGEPSVENPGLIWCDVTQLVRDWASGVRPNYGIALTNSTDRIIAFSSFEAPPDGEHPVHPNHRPSLAISIVPGEELDSDSDGVLDADDNCMLHANPNQRDTNQDGYGNRCDPDLNGDGRVAAADYARFLRAFPSSLGQPGFNPDADFNGDGKVGASDFSLLLAQYLTSPGPSGLVCAGSAPCP